jgi:hypothetical protein
VVCRIRFQATKTEDCLTEHIQVFSGHCVSSSRNDAPWHHLSKFFLASSFPPFMVELFGVRFCHLPSQVFAGSSEPVRPRERLSPDEPSPREPTLTEDISKYPRTPSLDFHQIRIRRPSIPDCWYRRHVSVAPTQIDCYQSHMMNMGLWK